MTGTRIMLALANKLACRQNEAKVKRVQKALEVAKTNAEEQAAQAADALDEVIQNFNKDSDVQELIQDISDAMCAADEAAETIAQLEKIEKFLFEELEVPDMPEE
jgi:GTP1/Obg family GTP-binding protein